MEIFPTFHIYNMGSIPGCKSAIPDIRDALEKVGNVIFECRRATECWYASWIINEINIDLKEDERFVMIPNHSENQSEVTFEITRRDAPLVSVTREEYLTTLFGE